MRVIGYIRVSTKDQGQNGFGLDAQRKSLEQWCIARGHQLLTVTSDVMSGGKSARLHGREVAINALESDLGDALLVRALDRASRDRLDAAKLQKRAEDFGWRLLDCDGADSSDTSTGLTADVRLAVAVEERRKISQRTREGMERARAQGTRSGRPIGRPKQIDPKAERRIRVMAGNGMGPRAIAKALEAEGYMAPRGGKAWSHYTVRDVIARQRKAKTNSSAREGVSA
ncbi:recombinase family protein [Mycolicibacterium brisbanense]|uniref:Putative resolvase n=1 Tax=Mycolicibacterium brisbanense TaxID=146020 RepID=A0A100W0M6_9MYCO|nr:recombinase family protein [Mycolicibacterium brisbanense]MCV7161868.1 recombinase family protein [Mycolicibacterium brisbanense]GAS89381.1 putative resolvase [Mycolicibacterium brisbanense]